MHCVCLVLVFALVVLRRVLLRRGSCAGCASLVHLLGVLVLDVGVEVGFRIGPSTSKLVLASVWLPT